MEDLANETRTSSTSDSGCQDIRTFWGGTGENRDGEGTATNVKGSVGQTKKGKERMGSAVEGYVEVESGESGPRIPKRASTRGMETHPIEEYDGFLQYLLTWEGGKKSEKNASGIVAKYHYYASPEEFNPKMSLKAKSVRAFVPSGEHWYWSIRTDTKSLISRVISNSSFSPMRTPLVKKKWTPKVCQLWRNFPFSGEVSEVRITWGSE